MIIRKVIDWLLRAAAMHAKEYAARYGIVYEEWPTA